MTSTKHTSLFALLLLGSCAYVDAGSESKPPVIYSTEYKETQEKPLVSLHIAGTEQVVLSADATHCPEVDAKGRRLDVPDAPLRAIRVGNGMLVVAAHYNNLAYTSSDLGGLQRRGCASMLRSSFDGDPSHFTDHEWLVSMYSQGARIFGLVHDEYWGGLYNPECHDRLGRREPWDDVCLYGSLTGAVSSDGGVTFRRKGLVAAYPYAFTADMNRNGVRDPSNVFYNPNDGYVYFMSWVDPRDSQKGGECLFRSKDPFSEPWTAWDGRGFNAPMGSPFRQKGVICEPVSGLGITTVAYSEAARAFVALIYDERIKPGGVFYRTSKDLIHWSRAELLMEGHNNNYWKKNDTKGPIVYPSLIDPVSASSNFDTVESEPYLYFIRWEVKDGRPQGRERDVVRIPLDLKAAEDRAQR